MDQAHIQPTTSLAPRTGTGRSVARLISDFGNPLLIPSLVMISLGILSGVGSELMIWIAGISVLFYSFIPFAVSLLLLRGKKILSLDIPVRKNRNRLFVYAIMSTTTGSLIIALLCNGRYELITQAAIVFLINPVIGYLINLSFKISIHSAALATAGTLFSFAYFVLPGTAGIWSAVASLCVFSFILPAVLWSRYRLGIHSFRELLSGVLAGIGFTLILILMVMLISR